MQHVNPGESEGEGSAVSHETGVLPSQTLRRQKEKGIRIK